MPIVYESIKNDNIGTVSKWFKDDGYNLSSFNQVLGIWQIDHPLPLPLWMSVSKDTIEFNTVRILS